MIRIAARPGLVALAVVLGVSAAVPAAAQGSGLVGYAEAVEHRVRGTVVLPGTVEARRLSTVAAEVAGYVVEMRVDEGDRVARDSPLALLRTVPYDLQLLALQGTLTEARARLELAQSNLERARELFSEDVISQQQIDDALSESIAWRGRVDQTEAQLKQVEVALDRCTIKAPFAGVVVRRLTEVGQWVAQGGPVVELVATRDLRVLVDVPERYFDLVRAGAEATVSFAAVPDLRVTGTIESLVPRADARSRTFPLRVTLPAPGDRVGAGMLADVSLPVGDEATAVLVPKDAVVRQGPDELVFRLADGDVIEPVPVATGRGVGEWIVVRGDIDAGDRVVTRGNERVRPGQSVTPTPTEYAGP